MRAKLTEHGKEKHLSFYCPGCKCIHAVPVEGHPHYWDWNEDLENPTLAPSLLIWQNRVNKPRLTLCHLFLRDGVLDFLKDSAHELAGQKVPLTEYPIKG